MQACIETAPPPTVNADPTWAMSFASPSTSGVRTAETLQGVPKSALQMIFGKSLGRRIWDQTRSKTGQATPVPSDAITDAEVSAGMVGYVSEQAADALREAGRQAKGLVLTITYADGKATLARAYLARSTNAAPEIAGAAIKLLRQLGIRDAAIASICLSMTDAENVTIRDTANSLCYSLPQPTARA